MLLSVSAESCALRSLPRVSVSVSPSSVYQSPSPSPSLFSHVLRCLVSPFIFTSHLTGRWEKDLADTRLADERSDLR